MRANGGGPMPKALERPILRHFGSIDRFTTAFSEAGLHQFGSGRIWLVARDGAPDILATPDAETPLSRDAHPLPVCDIWAHAYYPDYQNRRSDFLTAFIDHLVNWEFAAQRLAALLVGQTTLAMA